MSAKNPEYMTPAEVATAFRVDPKTVTRWVHAGRIPESATIRTLGGHRRFRTSYIQSLLRGEDGGRS